MTDTLNYSLIAILFLTNLATAFLYFSEKKRKSKDRQTSVDASELLMDLMQGEALIRVTRVAPNDVFLRSPRHGSR